MTGWTLRIPRRVSQKVGWESRFKEREARLWDALSGDHAVENLKAKMKDCSSPQLVKRLWVCLALNSLLDGSMGLSLGCLFDR